MSRWTWLLVDGYNLLHGWFGMNREEVSLIDKREKLIRLLMDYGGYHSLRTTVVFDGQGNLEEREVKSTKFDIIYGVQQETADQWIERRAWELVKQGWTVKVVTSDQLEQRVIFGAGALRVPCREMMEDMRLTLKEIRSEIAQREFGERNELSNRIDESVLSELERWRRGKV